MKNSVTSHFKSFRMLLLQLTQQLRSPNILQQLQYTCMHVRRLQNSYENNAHKFGKQLGKIITLEHCI